MTASPTPAVHRPRLGVLYDPTSVQALHLVEASAGEWGLVWLVDRDLAEPGTMARLLERLGRVADITGLDARQAGAVDGEPLDGVIAFNDSFLRRAAGIAAAHGLPYDAEDVVLRLTDKTAQRAALSAGGIEVPASARLHGDGAEQDWVRAVAGMTGRLIVKPVSANGSRGVFAVDGADAAVALMGERARSGAAEDMVVEERFVDGWPQGERPYGDFVTVETFASGGTLRTFGVTGCMPIADGFRLTGNFCPSALAPDEERAAVALAERAVTSLGCRTGVYHTEVKFTPDGPRVIEVNGRLGGGGVPRIAAAASGRDLIRAACLVALGRDPAPEVEGRTTDGVAYFHRVQPPPGASRVLAIDGIERVRSVPGVQEVAVNRRPGDDLGAADQGTRGFVYSVFGTAEDHAAFFGTLEGILDTVHVSYD